MNTPEPKTWKPGDVVLHRSGSGNVLRIRKEDDTGWWVVGSGGLDDRAFITGDWVHLDDALVSAVFVQVALTLTQ